jgi:hypothetical protein
METGSVNDVVTVLHEGEVYHAAEDENGSSE